MVQWTHSLPPSLTGRLSKHTHTHTHTHTHLPAAVDCCNPWSLHWSSENVSYCTHWGSWWHWVQCSGPHSGCGGELAGRGGKRCPPEVCVHESVDKKHFLGQLTSSQWCDSLTFVDSILNISSCGVPIEWRWSYIHIMLHVYTCKLQEKGMVYFEVCKQFDWGEPPQPPPPTHTHTHTHTYIPCGNLSSDLEVMSVWERSSSLRLSSGRCNRCPTPLSDTFTWLSFKTSMDLQPVATPKIKYNTCISLNTATFLAWILQYSWLGYYSILSLVNTAYMVFMACSLG